MGSSHDHTTMASRSLGDVSCIMTSFASLFLIALLSFGVTPVFATSGVNAGKDHHQLQQQHPHLLPPPFRGPKEYCYYETFDARCPDGEVVVMTTAVYGRMRFGRCVKTNFGFIGCFTDVLDLLDKRCSGRRGCSVEVVEPTFDNVRPCNMELKSYLEADYRCMKVVDYYAAECSIDLDRDERLVAVGPPPVLMPGISGHGSPAVAAGSMHQQCGTESRPWRIRVGPGQRINVTLIDFTASSTTDVGTDLAGNGMSRSVGEESGCFRSIGRVAEPSAKRSAEICAGLPGMRDSHVYVTQTSPVELYVNRFGTGNSAREYEYMIVFTVIGCPDYIEAGPDAWVRYSADRSTAEVGCRNGRVHGTAQTWQIACRGHEWTGFVDNCSLLAASQSSTSVQQEYNFFKLSAVVIALIVTGVSTIISLCVLVIGLFVFKRMKFRSSGSRLRQRVVMTCPATIDADDRHFRMSPEVVADANGTCGISTGVRCNLYQRQPCVGGGDQQETDECDLCRKHPGSSPPSSATLAPKSNCFRFNVAENGIGAHDENTMNDAAATAEIIYPGMSGCFRSLPMSRRPLMTNETVFGSECIECIECLQHAAAVTSMVPDT